MLAARLKLANAILSIATENSPDVGVLKQAALGANGCRPLGAKVSSALL
jgi:hypothetical protein